MVGFYVDLSDHGSLSELKLRQIFCLQSNGWELHLFWATVLEVSLQSWKTSRRIFEVEIHRIGHRCLRCIQRCFGRSSIFALEIWQRTKNKQGKKECYCNYWTDDYAMIVVRISNLLFRIDSYVGAVIGLNNNIIVGWSIVIVVRGDSDVSAIICFYFVTGRDFMDGSTIGCNNVALLWMKMACE